MQTELAAHCLLSCEWSRDETVQVYLSRFPAEPFSGRSEEPLNVGRAWGLAWKTEAE